jgi:hypothetical protein
MKTMLCLVSLIGSLAVGRAQFAGYGYGAGDCQVAPLAYTTPVVYSMPVVYQSPVIYYGPVFYLASAAAAACYTGCGSFCPAPSTVIHIGGSGGSYIYSNCGDDPYGSTVVYFGRGPVSVRSHRYSYFGY